jgi:HSP20 family protein
MLPAKRFYGQNFMPDFFNDFFGNMSLDGSSTKSPAINVLEDDLEYKLELAAPGMTKDDFKVHLNKDGNLVIESEKKCECKDECKEKDEKKRKYIRKEFSYMKMHQTLILPENTDKEGIRATVENGVLKIDIPKLQKPKVEEEKRMIEVK